MSDIYISYAPEDAGRIEPLARAFLAEGMTVDWDHSFNAGRSWLREVDLSIREAGVVVVVWTSGSVDSRWIREEAQLAQALGTLLPVQLEMTRAAQPIAFRNIQVFDLSDWDGQSADEHLSQLIALVRRRLRERGANQSNAAGSPQSMPTLAPMPVPDAPPSPRSPQPTPQFPWPAPAPAPSAPPHQREDLEIPEFLRRRPAVASARPSQDVAAVPAALAAPPTPAPIIAQPEVPHVSSAMVPPDVFVAYSRKDEAVCKQVVMALRGEGLNVFYDQYIEGGQEWREIIAQNIKGCSVFMVLFSANSLKSDQVRKEVNHATDNSRSVVPVMIENVKLDGGLALELNGINFIPYFDNPVVRLPEVVEKARNLAAIAVFDRRRDYIQANEPHAFVDTRGVPATPLPAISVSPARWARGLMAIGGAIVLSLSASLLVARVSGSSTTEWTAVIACALFFLALPYVVGVMMLFDRLLRDA